ncbi:hypothetical protein SpCBS45565_g02631 [Spizellomyces sp. 'palustris']|nr:hypothetical protein SpCBS45565_g02631 [Spizellomyces sp. 'palustris']
MGMYTGTTTDIRTDMAMIIHTRTRIRIRIVIGMKATATTTMIMDMTINIITMITITVTVMVTIITTTTAMRIRTVTLMDTPMAMDRLVSSSLRFSYGFTVGWQWTDPLCSLFIAILTIISLWPLLKSSGATLLQRVPEDIGCSLADAYRKVNSIEGVVSFSQPHFWEVSQGNNVGTIKVQMRHDLGDEEKLRLQVASVFQEIGVRNMVVQIEKTAPVVMGVGSYVG